MDSETTHTIGFGDAVKMESPFHAMNVVPRFRRTGSMVVKNPLNWNVDFWPEARLISADSLLAAVHCVGVWYLTSVKI